VPFAFPQKYANVWNDKYDAHHTRGKSVSQAGRKQQSNARNETDSVLWSPRHHVFAEVLTVYTLQSFFHYHKITPSSTRALVWTVCTDFTSNLAWGGLIFWRLNVKIVHLQHSTPWITLDQINDVNCICESVTRVWSRRQQSILQHADEDERKTSTCGLFFQYCNTRCKINCDTKLVRYTFTSKWTITLSSTAMDENGALHGHPRWLLQRTLHAGQQTTRRSEQLEDGSDVSQTPQHHDMPSLRVPYSNPLPLVVAYQIVSVRRHGNCSWSRPNHRARPTQRHTHVLLL